LAGSAAFHRRGPTETAQYNTTKDIAINCLNGWDGPGQLTFAKEQEIGALPTVGRDVVVT
jgi:hypothetical protein